MDADRKDGEGDAREGCRLVVRLLARPVAFVIAVIGLLSALAGLTVDWRCAVSAWAEPIVAVGELLRGASPAWLYYGVCASLLLVALLLLVGLAFTRPAAAAERRQQKEPAGGEIGASQEQPALGPRGRLMGEVRDVQHVAGGSIKGKSDTAEDISRPERGSVPFSVESPSVETPPETEERGIDGEGRAALEEKLSEEPRRQFRDEAGRTVMAKGTTLKFVEQSEVSSHRESGFVPVAELSYEELAAHRARHKGREPQHSALNPPAPSGSLSVEWHPDHRSGGHLRVRIFSNETYSIKNRILAGGLLLWDEGRHDYVSDSAGISSKFVCVNDDNHIPPDLMANRAFHMVTDLRTGFRLNTTSPEHPEFEEFNKPGIWRIMFKSATGDVEYGVLCFEWRNEVGGHSTLAAVDCPARS